MKARFTKRGFARYEFTDHYGDSCSLQASSLATKSCIWLGVDPVRIMQDGWHPQWSARMRELPEDARRNLHAFGRMHLTQELAAELLPLLQHFVDTGELPTPQSEER